MSSSRLTIPRAKMKSHVAAEDYDMMGTTLDPTMKYVDVHSSTPWTTSEKSWRAASAPQLWPQELRTSLSPSRKPRSQLGGESEDEDPFGEERTTLTDMKKSVNKINKFYIPISKLPPLGGLDPRRNMADRPPSCYPDRGIPRASRIIQRWQSMPRLRSQLPAESLQVIEAAMKRDKRDVRWLDNQKQRLEKPPGQHSNRGSSRGDRQPSGRREDTDARMLNAYWEAEEGSARGKKEHPHIPCACCDHKVEKTWMQPKDAENPPGSGRKSPGRKSPRPVGHNPGPASRGAASPVAPDFARASSPGTSDSACGRAPGSGRPHSVSFEDPVRGGREVKNKQDAVTPSPLSEGSSAGSEHWPG